MEGDPQGKVISQNMSENEMDYRGSKSTNIMGLFGCKRAKSRRRFDRVLDRKVYSNGMPNGIYQLKIPSNQL
ncbi:hypothetical protein AYI68_g8405 [Smittium mucronatum]|uniref:Uncharacterized protein n=1 Tax=Smittium mucronatum TaxID=133383 RepID=A0A1R0GKZ5_9FUNG|nr:hypothetical protein AYI68_g8405 [Smittium mucronatum]